MFLAQMGYQIFAQMGYKLSLFCPLYIDLLSCQFAQMSFAGFIGGEKTEYPAERTTNLSQVTDKLYHIKRYIEKWRNKITIGRKSIQ
jgi:hypothetical protein